MKMGNTNTVKSGLSEHKNTYIVLADRITLSPVFMMVLD